MPRVPTYQPNQVAPVEITRERLRPANNNGGVFGAIGEGLQELGGTLAWKAEDQDRLNAQNDDTQARLLTAEAGLAYSTATTEYTQLQAGAARESQAAYNERLAKIRDEAIGRASNPRMQQLLEERLAGLHSAGVTQIATHAVRQQRVEREAGFGAQVAAYSEMATSTSDVALRDQYIASAVAVQRDKLVEIDGMDPEMVPELFAIEELKITSAVHGSVISSMLAVPNPEVDEITTYLEAYGDEMTMDVKQGVLSSIQGPLQDRSARSGAQLVRDRLAGLGSPSAAPVAEEATLAMPVEGSIPRGGRFADGRDGGARQHRALDISAPVGTPIYTIAPGRVTAVKPLDGASGNWVEVTHPDGTTSTYSHMNDFSVAVGDSVAAGAVLGSVGNTGAGTGPHLHLVTRDSSGARVDPESLLGRTVAYTPAPQEWDRASAYQALEEVAEAQGWNPEETERVRAQLDRDIARDESLLAEQRADADEAAAELILQQGEGFTSTNMIPRDVWGRMSVSQRASAEAVAERNRTPAPVAANGARATELSLMRYYEPERFKELDLSGEVGGMTAAELESLLLTQARMRTTQSGGEEGWSPRSGIVTALNYGVTMNPGLVPSGQDGAQQRAAILQIMEADALRMRQQNGGKDLTEQDYQTLFRRATRERTIRSDGWLWDSERQVRQFEITVDQIPDATRDRLEQRLQQSGLEASDENLLRLYRTSPR